MVPYRWLRVATLSARTELQIQIRDLAVVKSGKISPENKDEH